MQIMKFILSGIGIIALIPSFLLFPALIVTVIIGASKIEGILGPAIKDGSNEIHQGITNTVLPILKTEKLT